MSGNFVSNACRLIGAHLTGTTNTTVITAVGYVQVIGIRLANITAVNATASVAWFSSVANDQYRLLFEHTIPAKGQVWLPLEAFALNENDQIRVHAQTANAIDVTLSISEIPGRSG